MKYDKINKHDYVVSCISTYHTSSWVERQQRNKNFKLYYSWYQTFGIFARKCPELHTYMLDMHPHECVSYALICKGVTEIQVKIEANGTPLLLKEIQVMIINYLNICNLILLQFNIKLHEQQQSKFDIIQFFHPPFSLISLIQFLFYFI
ncbi:unnamed protein product [Paramecium octaurelia]|uniref:Uncharacterized protein n=1 Tax=Paramecium octaurelia TaxID=43137 RepID=A0A8S1STQ9_PAROT|nr:unnamed protein product [Paramecium octaurelia]